MLVIDAVDAERGLLAAGATRVGFEPSAAPLAAVSDLPADVGFTARRRASLEPLSANVRADYTYWSTMQCAAVI